MADIKWYHKILVVILVIAAFWKISNLKIGNWGKKPAAQSRKKPTPPPVQREPDRVTVIREIREVPAPAAPSQPQPVYPWGTQPWPNTAPVSSSYYPPYYQQQTSVSSGCGGESSSSGTVYIGDDAMSRYNGRY